MPLCFLEEGHHTPKRQLRSYSESKGGLLRVVSHALTMHKAHCTVEKIDASGHSTAENRPQSESTRPTAREAPLLFLVTDRVGFDSFPFWANCAWHLPI